MECLEVTLTEYRNEKFARTEYHLNTIWAGNKFCSKGGISDEVLASDIGYTYLHQLIDTLAIALHKEMYKKWHVEKGPRPPDLEEWKLNIAPAEQQDYSPAFRKVAVPDDSYRNKATSEFEGVEGLDPSLWEGTDLV